MAATTDVVEPLTVDFPETVTLEVAEAEPSIKGQTVTSSYKPAVLENGVNRELEVAVIPLGGESTGRAAALLLLRSQEIQLDPDEDERKLFAEAKRLQASVVSRFAV